MKRTAPFILVALFLSLTACASNKPSPGPAVRDLSDRVVQPLNMAGQRAVVLIFITSECPISNAYAPEIVRLAADYQPRGVSVCLVHADPKTSIPDARKHAADYSLTSLPIVIDHGHRLAYTTGATMTPEAAVVDPAGKIVYRGRINDLFADLGVKRTAPTTRDLRDALDQLLAGKPIEHPRTPAIGCNIPDLN